MKTYKSFLAALSGIWVTLSGQAQGFVNLDFESANLAPIPAGQFGGNVSSLDAIPGWTGFLGTDQVTQVLQNNLTLGNASIDILTPNWNVGDIIGGQYTIVLQPGRGPNGGGSPPNVGASISQTAVVPANAVSLQFKAAIATPFSVSLGGQTLILVPLGTGANYTLYGANIPLGNAGQSEALTIAALVGPNSADYFDSFVFASSLVPEPSMLALACIGGALFCMYRRRGN